MSFIKPGDLFVLYRHLNMRNLGSDDVYISANESAYMILPKQGDLLEAVYGFSVTGADFKPITIGKGSILLCIRRTERDSGFFMTFLFDEMTFSINTPGDVQQTSYWYSKCLRKIIC